jgi:hypothetical protein
MLEQKARVQLDHLRGMTSEQVAQATLRTLERGRNEVCLTIGGRLVVLVSRFLPRVADWVVRRRVRAIFRDEIARRRESQADAADASRLPAAPPRAVELSERKKQVPT